jgi:hypothetical protein
MPSVCGTLVVRDGRKPGDISGELTGGRAADCGPELVSLPTFSKASLMDPRFGPAWITFAHSFAYEGEHEQAITAYSTSARLFPG